MKMALPRKGLRGVEKIADTTAWTNSMAESGGAQVKEKYASSDLCIVESAIYVFKRALIKYYTLRYYFQHISV